MPIKNKFYTRVLCSIKNSDNVEFLDIWDTFSLLIIKIFNQKDMSQKIRIKLKSYDHNLVDKSAEKIVRTVKATGAVVSGPIPLPTHKRIFTVNRSTFVNKKSREQFELSSYKRLIDIYSSTTKTVDALMKLELPSGVEVEIKVW